jgi:surfactin synthase thioesterase subunit
MAGETFVLLPGLDGTGALFGRFLALTPLGANVTQFAFPRDRVLSYDELSELVLSALPESPFVLVGESFSGPLALRVARRRQPLGVVLCAAMVRAPTLQRLSAAPLSFLLSARPRVSLVKLVLTGGDEELAVELVNAVSTVEREVIASRIRMVLTTDAIPDAVACACPLAYLRATRDPLVGSGQAAAIREARDDVTVTNIDGPHLLLQKKPEECWARIRVFTEQALVRSS